MFSRFGVSEIIFVCFSSLGLAACGGGGGGGGGGPVIATSSYERSGSSLSDSTSNSYDSNLDATWVARQEYKNVRYMTTQMLRSLRIQNPEVPSTHTRLLASITHLQ